MNANDCFKALGLDPAQFETGDLEVTSPIDGAVIGRVQQDTKETLDKKSRWPSKHLRHGRWFRRRNAAKCS